MSTSRRAEIVGLNIRRAREAKGLSQFALSRVLDCREFQVWRWEKGKHKPNDDRLEQIAEALDTDYVSLLTAEPLAA